MRRHGAVELLVVLPDGSKTMLPAGFTDAAPASAEPMAVTVGSVEDLIQLTVVVASLLPPVGAAGGVPGEASGVPTKEDPGGPDQSVGVRSRRPAAGGRVTTGGSATGSAGSGPGGGGGQAGVADRQVARRDGVHR